MNWAADLPLVRAARERGEFALRDEATRRALEINPDLGFLQSFKLKSLLKTQQYAEARAYAAEMNPVNFDQQAGQGPCLAQLLTRHAVRMREAGKALGYGEPGPTCQPEAGPTFPKNAASA